LFANKKYYPYKLENNTVQ